MTVSEASRSVAAVPVSPRSAGDGALTGLVAATGMIGVAGAMVVTSVSLFLADEVHVTPLMIGVFFAGRAAAEIATDLIIGVVSDRAGNRRALLALCSAFSAAGAVSYVLLRDYRLLFVTGAVFFGIGGATFPQLFAYTREFAQARGLGVAFFNSALRAVTSAAWIVGPPLGLLLIADRGFSFGYGVAAALYAVSAVLCLRALPNVHGIATSAVRRPFSGLNRAGALLLASIVLMVTVNMMYQIDIALFVTKDLGFGVGFAGLVLGTTSALEVPIMLYVGARADRFGKWRLVGLATVSAAVFFAVLPLATTRVELLLLQVPNALFTAIILSLPVVILQDAMPDRPGVAAALYSGAFKAGAFLGGAIAGVVAAWLGFTHLFWVCAGLSLAATVLLVLGRRP